MQSITSEKIQPDMFFGDKPPDRIIGVECEYNIQPPNNDIVGQSISKEALKLARVRSLPITMGGRQHQYTELGSRIYEDCGHAEYCTPECRGPYQAAAADIASISIMASIIESSEVEPSGVYRISGTWPHKTESGYYQNTTNGIHENFMAPSNLAHNKLLKNLLPSYYSTRVAAMGGTIIENSYAFSQKARGISGNPIEHALVRRVSAAEKPMATILNSEYETVGLDWMRLETRFADAPPSLNARRHALATTSLLLRIVEHQSIFEGNMPDGIGDFESMMLRNPSAAAHMFMSDLSLKSTAEVFSGKRMTMLDIQEQFAKNALYLAECITLPSDEIDAANVWIEICDAFRRSNPKQADYDRYLLEKRYTVATKHAWLTHIKDAFSKGDKEAKTRSLQWDRILPIGNGRQLLEKTCDDPEVKQLQKTAPPTRAAIRAQFIDKYYGSAIAAVPSWNQGILGTPNSASTFSDPYGNRE